MYLCPININMYLHLSYKIMKNIDRYLYIIFMYIVFVFRVGRVPYYAIVSQITYFIILFILTRFYLPAKNKQPLHQNRLFYQTSVV